MNRKILEGFVCCGALVFTISACATVKNFAGLFGIRNTSKEQAMEKNISIFARTIRPVMGNPDSHYNLAHYYQDRGNHWEAIIEFEKTLAIDPVNVKALNAMGVSYDCLKEFERASECYQAALKLCPNSAYIYNNMGQSLVLQGKYIPAIEAFKKATAYDKDFPDVRIHNNLGRAYAMTGQYDLALAEFEQVSKGVSAKSILDRVLHEAEGQPPASETLAAVAAGDEVKAFSGKVAKFLQERSADNVQHEIATAAPAPQKQLAMDVADSICIEVSNGNGVRFIARDIRDYLNKKGFRVSRVTNGNKMAQTHIYYEKGHAQEAKVLASQMPVVVEIKEMSRLDVTGIKVRLLLGKDMARHMRNPSQDSHALSSWIGA